MPISTSNLRLVWPALCLTLLSCASAHAFTKSGTIYTTDGSQADVKAAIVDASAGDTVNIPAGTFTWGAGGDYVGVNKAITLSGAGIDVTILQLATTASSGNNGTIRMQANGCVVKSFTIKAPAAGNSATPFSASTSSGWRLTQVKYDATGQFSYFVRVLSSAPYGLIDNCTVIGGGGSNELIFAEGPSDSWQTANSFGGASNLFVEDCTFSGSGYVCDINNNGRAVLRFNTVNGNMKIDGHGYASNSARGVRHMEVYGNRWTAAAGSWDAIELRGGGLRVFANRTDYKAGTSVFWPNFRLTDYGATSNAWGNFSNTYQTPFVYPIKDQIGVGIDPKTGASEPAYLWDNVAGTISHAPGIDWTLSWSTPASITGTTDATGYAVGATSITLTAQSAQVKTTDYVKFAGDPNYYRVAVQKNSGAGTLVIAAPGLLQELPTTPTAMASGANILYQQQTGNASATYTVQDLIAADRDYFKHTTGATFNGSSGVGMGTKAAMLAITSTKTGVGFWVTDEGSWDTTKAANTSGQLYRWTGSAWALHYTPYTYPHPLRRPGAPSNVLIRQG